MIHHRQKRYIIPFDDVPSDRAEMPEISVDDRRGNFTEVETGFTEEIAFAEAKRCLSCRRCLGCGLCLAVCEPKAIVFEQADESIGSTADVIAVSNRSEPQAPPLGDGDDHSGHENIVSTLEFERILSSDGPYGGLILRPFDGEIPKRIGFICPVAPEHTESGRKRHLGFSLAFKLALSASQKVKDLEIWIFAPGDTDPNDLFQAENHGMTIEKGIITWIKEQEKTKDLIVTSEADDGQTEEHFDMLVISGWSR